MAFWLKVRVLSIPPPPEYRIPLYHTLVVQLRFDHFKNLLDKLMFLYLLVWEFGLYHFHKLVDYE